MSRTLNIVFAGTPEFAANQLQALLDSSHSVVACYTQPDRPAGRGRKLTPSPVKALALSHDIDVYQPTNFKSAEDRQALAELKPDLMVVVAYGLLLPQAVLDIPALGCINVHASLLPRWRGAAPIQRAIAAGDTESGVTIMQMNAGLDTGNMLLKVSTSINPEDTGGSLHDRLAEISGPALIQVLNQLASGPLPGEAQDDSLATYASKLSKEESRINWQQSAQVIDRHIRAFNPWPVAHTQLDDQTIRLWQALPLDSSAPEAAPGTLVQVSKNGIDVATGDGVLRILELQLSGGKRLPVSAILNGKGDWLTPGKQFL